jgi:hypothetical protein
MGPKEREEGATKGDARESLTAQLRKTSHNLTFVSGALPLKRSLLL